MVVQSPRKPGGALRRYFIGITICTILKHCQCIGHRYRRLNPPSSSMDRHRRLQALIRHGISMGRHRIRQFPGYRGSDSPQYHQSQADLWPVPLSLYSLPALHLTSALQTESAVTMPAIQPRSPSAAAIALTPISCALDPGHLTLGVLAFPLSISFQSFTLRFVTPGPSLSPPCGNKVTPSTTFPFPRPRQHYQPTTSLLLLKHRRTWRNMTACGMATESLFLPPPQLPRPRLPMGAEIKATLSSLRPGALNWVLKCGAAYYWAHTPSVQRRLTTISSVHRKYGV